MTDEGIEQYLREVNNELALLNVKGEICLFGGAVMCLVFKTRPATEDVDPLLNRQIYASRPRLSKAPCYFGSGKFL